MMRWLWGWVPNRLLDRAFYFERGGEVLSSGEVGVLGERIAVAYLRRMGRKVLYRNYRGPRGGEIDIIVRDGEVLCFVEVKARRRREGSRPLDAVGKEKQDLIERGARAWLKLLPDTDFVWRFDVVEVVLEDGEVPEVTVVDEAF
ncbi:YraN family protein [Rubritalea tangerina]|uniref:UPF0102 protein ACFSW8_01585 n=1 Tax=Rubritalea tangerina TaxID=430798 RepID=A0ABW4Z6N6_9BACT